MDHFRQIGLLALTIVTVSLSTASADTSFYGSSATTVTCENSRGGLGYSYQFLNTVKDGAFHGLHGTVGEPGYLKIDGKIEPDGTGRLYARGMIGSREYVPGRAIPR